MSFFRRKPHKLTVQDGINLSRTQQNAVLIDVRGKEEFRQKHIAGSVNIPMDHLEFIERRIPDKDALLYVVGSYTNRPKKAIRSLHKFGYHNMFSCGYIEEHYGHYVYGG